jgi:hypothetical protein
MCHQYLPQGDGLRYGHKDDFGKNTQGVEDKAQQKGSSPACMVK